MNKVDIETGEKVNSNNAGGIGGTIIESELNLCLNEGNISGRCDNVGGISGDAAGTIFRNCSNKGTLKGSSYVRRHLRYG